VCAYNEEKYILACLTSIAKSLSISGRLHRFKLVCVDNSSTDNTWDLAQKFSALPVHYECIKIQHSPLCVSRNSYKFYSDFDYVAYLDADGGVDLGWARNLLDIVDSTKPDIVSGPVLNLPETGNQNGLWEVFYDSSIFETDNYLIGANMCFSAEFLHSADGFPHVFDSRGDETCLLLKAHLLGLVTNVHFHKNVIAYNHFPNSKRNFLKEQFYDGIRSYQIARLWPKHNFNFIIVIFRLVRLLGLLLALILMPISYLGAALCFLVSMCQIIFRRPRYIVNIFKKVMQKSNSATIIDGLAALVSFYFRDLGFLKGLLSKNPVLKGAIFSSPRPNRVMLDD
ncbi:MAG: glycosyltransferase family 2 protein, partial [Emcibacteraceae bacterium]|nr:glycosyltransferase family 2 protein [Emcibacteraceae bacterium]